MNDTSGRSSDHRSYDPVFLKPVSQAPSPLFSRMEEDQVKELDALLQKRVAEANKKMEKIARGYL